MTHDRLPSGEASLLKDLLMRGGLIGRVSITRAQRPFVLPLWRKGLIEIWHRQAAIDEPMPPRAFYGLTTYGYQRANAIASAARHQAEIRSLSNRTKGDGNARVSQ